MRKYILSVLLMFFFSRLFLSLLGVKFESLDSTIYFLQIIDPFMLKKDLILNLYYTSFPPFYNLIIGVLFKLFSKPEFIIYLFFLLLGIILSLSMFILMLELGINPWISFIATTFFMISPPTILYENWPFYTYFLTTFTCLTALFFIKFIRKLRLKYGILLFTCYTLLALTNARYTYLLIIILSFIIFHILYSSKGKKSALFSRLIISVIPVLVVFAVCVKNYNLFDKFNVDAHFGFHMGNGFYLASMEDKVIRDKFEKEYDLFLTVPISPVYKFKGKINPPEKTNVPLLDRMLKSTGHINYHNLYYIKISDLYTSLIKEFILKDSLLYLRFLTKSMLNYITPSNDYGLLGEKNKNAIKIFHNWYNNIYPLILLAYLFAILNVLHLLTKNYKKLITKTGIGKKMSGSTFDLSTMTALSFIVMFIAYNGLAVFFTFGENNRYKFSIEPLLFVLIAFSINVFYTKFVSIQTRLVDLEQSNQVIPDDLIGDN